MADTILFELNELLSMYFKSEKLKLLDFALKISERALYCLEFKLQSEKYEVRFIWSYFDEISTNTFLKSEQRIGSMIRNSNNPILEGSFSP